MCMIGPQARRAFVRSALGKGCVVKGIDRSAALRIEGDHRSIADRLGLAIDRRQQPQPAAAVAVRPIADLIVLADAALKPKLASAAS